MTNITNIKGDYTYTKFCKQQGNRLDVIYVIKTDKSTLVTRDEICYVLSDTWDYLSDPSNFLAYLFILVCWMELGYEIEKRGRG